MLNNSLDELWEHSLSVASITVPLCILNYFYWLVASICCILNHMLTVNVAHFWMESLTYSYGAKRHGIIAKNLLTVSKHIDTHKLREFLDADTSSRKGKYLQSFGSSIQSFGSI